MQRGLVLAAGLGIGAAEREVDRAADLLVEEDRADRAVDAEVRADAELAEAPARRRRWRARAGGSSSPWSARASTTSPSRNVELDARDVRRRRGRRGRRSGCGRWPIVSCGPVKTSPLGMLRLPSLLTHVRPLTRQREVGALGLDADLARLAPAGRSSSAWNWRSPPHAATGSGRSRKSARSTNALERRRATCRPPGRAPRSATRSGTSAS